MKQDKWAKQLHDKLGDHEVEAPEGLWADIENALDAQATKPKPAFIGWHKWMAAAAVALLLASGGIWWMKQDNTSAELKGEKVIANTEPQHSQSSQQAEQPTDIEVHQISENFSLHSSTNHQIQNDFAGSYLAEKAISADNNHAESEAISTEQKTEDYTAMNSEQPKAEEQIASTPSAEKGNKQELAVNEEKVNDELDRQIAEYDHKNKSASINLYAMNGFGTSQNSNGVMMDSYLASRFNDAYNASNGVAAKRMYGSNTIYMAGYEEKEKHYQPISIGITASYPLTERLSIVSGVVYTRLRSDFTKIVRTQKIDQQQTLQYIGVPLTLDYKLWEYKGLKTYLAISGEADWNVNAKVETQGVKQDMHKDRMQWSANGNVGIQYNIIPQIGIYAEPGIKYYFDNKSNVQNYFKDKPFSFNLQLGVRVNLAK